MERRRRILVAPLDWGLGHATRCIPIIMALIKRNTEVIIAASGSSALLLKMEFPELRHYPLVAYDPQYPAGAAMVWKMGRQLPRFIQIIQKEHTQLEEIVAREQIDVVISDNRYGCYSSRAKSVFITHQLHILMPDSFKWMEGIVNRFNRRQIKKFDACWVPAPDNRLLGRLLPERLPLDTRVIGYLSRLKRQVAEKKYEVAVIASGPEPQRTILVDVLRRALQESGLKSILVRGDVDGEEQTTISGTLEEVNYLMGDSLERVIAQSEIVIARSGYSTVMDLAQMGAKAIFIPTPGQTEQGYLAEQLMGRGIAFSVPQTDFDLKTALKEANKFSGFANFGNDEVLLDLAIQSIL